MLQVVTANRLVDGDVVYLARDGHWSVRLADGRTAGDKQEADALMAGAGESEADQVVVAPYLVEVTAENGTVRAVRYKERIRASGPTIRPDLGRRAVER